MFSSQWWMPSTSQATIARSRPGASCGPVKGPFCCCLARHLGQLPADHWVLHQFLPGARREGLDSFDSFFGLLDPSPQPEGSPLVCKVPGAGQGGFAQFESLLSRLRQGLFQQYAAKACRLAPTFQCLTTFLVKRGLNDKAPTLMVEVLHDHAKALILLHRRIFYVQAGMATSALPMRLLRGTFT